MSKAAARAVLAKLDAKPFGFFHLKMIVVAGMGFIADAYDLFSISLITNMLGRIYFQDNPFYVNNFVYPGKLPINYYVAISAVALWGTLLGQIGFGILADMFGRKVMYGLALWVMMFAGFSQSMTFGRSSTSMVGTLCFWRFILGIGVGGDYPLSATIISEYASTASRGALIASVFAMQGIGYLFAGVVTAIVGTAFQTAYPNGGYPLYVGVPGPGNSGVWIGNTDENRAEYVRQIKASCPPENDYTWRIVLAISALPAAATMYCRLSMAETPRFTLHVLKKTDILKNDMAAMTEGKDDDENETVDSNQDIFEIDEEIDISAFVQKYGVQLTGAALSWFFVDIGFFSQGLYQKETFKLVGLIPPGIRMSALSELIVTAKVQSLIALGSTIPGYWVTVFTVDILGRKSIQIGGFIAMTFFMAAMSSAFYYLVNPNNSDGTGLSSDQPAKRNGWIAMYAFTFFFANWGPNATTYIVPAELFPTAWRATGHGICAAVGKAGAIVGALGFMYASQPGKMDTTWSHPCVYDTDFNYDASMPPNQLGCKKRNNCPIGLASSTNSIVPSLCDYCNPRLLSGCAPFGIGARGALGVLAAINLVGLLTTFLIPETMGKSLEQLNGEEISDEEIKNEALQETRKNRGNRTTEITISQLEGVPSSAVV